MQNRLLLQFHITGRCNLRCKHCYRTEGDTEPLSLQEVLTVIEEYKSLWEEYNRYYGIDKRGHINITGGEPFIRENIKDILEYLGKNSRYFSFGILSNGSFIDDGMISLLKKSKVAHIQLSIDGDKTTHDYIRAQGDYDRVFAMAERLESNGIRTMISFTASKSNYKHLPIIADECRKKKISKLWTDRLVPIGNGTDLETIGKDDLKGYLASIKSAQGGVSKGIIYPKTQITGNRALQFLGCKGDIYSCGAGNTLITVDEFGNIMPCRRLPIICGNVFRDRLSDIYFKNKIFIQLRSRIIPEECLGCKYSLLCRGGAKCQSYAVYGNLHSADPACYLKRKEL